MTYTTIELTEAKYNEVVAMPSSKAELEVCGATMVYGYGVYGFKLYTENNKYFATFSHGSSCD